MEEISEEQLKETLHSFEKDKSPGSNGWPIEFFLAHYETVVPDLLQLAEESKKWGDYSPPLNATFIALIQKLDNPSSLDDYIPISVCNVTYKVVAKIITRRLKNIMSKVISWEQFGFLEGRQIHEAIEVSQEGIHSQKITNNKGDILKIDISKDFDR